VAVRYRQEALFPCLHPCLPVQVPLALTLLPDEGNEPVQRWQLLTESGGFEPLTAEAPAGDPGNSGNRPLQASTTAGCTLDLRL
jgi:hypothetical protein